MKYVIFCLVAFFASQAEFTGLPGDDGNAALSEDKLLSQLGEIDAIESDPLLQTTNIVGQYAHTQSNNCLPRAEMTKYNRYCQSAYDQCNRCYNGEKNEKAAEKCCNGVIKTLKKQVKVTHDKAVECQKNKKSKNSSTDESKNKKN